MDIDVFGYDEFCSVVSHTLFTDAWDAGEFVKVLKRASNIEFIHVNDWINRQESTMERRGNNWTITHMARMPDGDKICTLA